MKRLLFWTILLAALAVFVTSAPAQEKEGKPSSPAKPDAKSSEGGPGITVEKPVPMAKGDVLKAKLGADGYADVFYGDGTRFQIMESSEFIFFAPFVISLHAPDGKDRDETDGKEDEGPGVDEGPEAPEGPDGEPAEKPAEKPAKGGKAGEGPADKPEATPAKTEKPAVRAESPKRYFQLLRGGVTITFKKNPALVRLPLGDVVFWGDSAVATVNVVPDEQNPSVSNIQVTNGSATAVLRFLVASKQLEIAPGKSLKLSSGGLSTIASAGKVVPPAATPSENTTDTYQYHLGEKGFLDARFKKGQRLLAGQKADLTLAVDRRGDEFRALVSLKTGFFRANLKGRYFRLKTPSNRIIINGATFWARIDSAGEWDRIQHQMGAKIIVESRRVPGFSINVPLKGGADVIHPKDSKVVLLSVHKGLPPARPIIIKFGSRIFELPPEGELKPEPAAGTMHPEKAGTAKVLFEEGAVQVMIYRVGQPLSYRFIVDENDLRVPRGDAFKDAGDVKTVKEASPFLR